MDEVKIHIEGEGLAFDGITSFSKAAQVIAFVKSETVTSEATAMNRRGVLPTAIGHDYSPRQVIVEANAKTNPQKIAALGRYICTRSQTDTFSASEVLDMMKRAGETLPKNFSRDLKHAVVLEYIYEGEEGQFILTEKGKEAVDHHFESAEKVRGSKTRRVTRRASGAVADEVLNMEIATEAEGFPRYWEIKNKGHRILWILAYAHQRKILELTRKEVEALAKRLHDNIESRHVGPLIGNAFKKGFLATAPGGKFRILQPGIKFIREYKATDADETQ